MRHRKTPRAESAIRRWAVVGMALAGLLAASRAPAEQAGLIGRWKLAGDANDVSGTGLNATNHGAEFGAEGPDGKTPVAAFNGKDSFFTVPTAPSLRLGIRDFTVALWLHTDEILDDDLGDLVTQYDGKKRVGFNLSLRNNAGVTSCQANTRLLQFGIDSASEPKWADEGQPGNAILAFALAVHDGRLYAGTAANGKDNAGHVYRYDGASRWIDCGTPDACNAISALAVYQGKLYAASSKYRFAGSALQESENVNSGGKVFSV